MISREQFYFFLIHIMWKQDKVYRKIIGFFMHICLVRVSSIKMCAQCSMSTKVHESNPTDGFVGICKIKLKLTQTISNTLCVVIALKLVPRFIFDSVVCRV